VAAIAVSGNARALGAAAAVRWSFDGSEVLMARRLQPRPKERRKVPIPAELRDALREVVELIRQARRDPDVVLDYDDAIQIGAVCGGRIGRQPRPYVLTYFPEGDRQRGRWCLTLHRTEIEDIAEGRMTELTLFCCTSPDCRCKFREETGTCFFCDYEDDEGTRHFKARLEALAKTVRTKEEWVAGYLPERPDATAASLLADYNPIEGLGDRLGWFSFPEAEALLEKVRDQG
jgi:hypothetical protein